MLSRAPRHDAELAATEIVRRAERRIGQLVREGQEAGEIRKKGVGGGDPRFVDPAPRVSTISPKEYLPDSKEAADAYAMTDGVDEETFEDAIDEAREEKNLKRANVVRKIKAKKNGESSPSVRRSNGRRAPRHDLQRSSDHHWC